MVKRFSKRVPGPFNGERIPFFTNGAETTRLTMVTWAMTPKAQRTKEKIGKSDFVKIKNVCASKYMIKKVRNQGTEWEKIFANHISDKGFVFRIYFKKILTTQQ